MFFSNTWLTSKTSWNKKPKNAKRRMWYLTYFFVKLHSSVDKSLTMLIYLIIVLCYILSDYNDFVIIYQLVDVRVMTRDAEVAMVTQLSYIYLQKYNYLMYTAVYSEIKIIDIYMVFQLYHQHRTILYEDKVYL